MRRPAAALVLAAAMLPPGKRQAVSAKALVYCLLPVIIHSGCATARIYPTPPASVERATFGTIVVARAFHLAETGVDAHAREGVAGAGKGAGTAFATVPGRGVKVSSDVSSGAGAMKAMPGKEAASYEMLALEILERTNPQEDLQDELLRAWAKEKKHRHVLVEEAGPATVDNVATYDSLAGKGIDTVLEASVERIALGAIETGSDPPLALVIEARSRLIHVGNGTAVNDHKHDNIYRYASSPRKFAEWAADNATLLDKEYESAVRGLAVAIAWWNFVSRF